MKARALKIISATVGIIGLALLAMMVVVESEPGLIPLLLILLGTIGYAAAHVRGKASRS